MSTVNVLLLGFGVVTGLIMLGSGIVKLSGQPVIKERAEHFAVPWERYRLIGVLELAAAVGIAIGHWVHALGLAAGIGVLALMLGAVSFHVRFGDPVKVMTPALVVLAAAGGYTAAQAAAVWG
jgi:DoxX-like protein